MTAPFLAEHDARQHDFGAGVADAGLARCRRSRPAGRARPLLPDMGGRGRASDAALDADGRAVDLDHRHRFAAGEEDVLDLDARGDATLMTLSSTATAAENVVEVSVRAMCCDLVSQKPEVRASRRLPGPRA
jgi:hypothetical protein